MSTYKRQGNRKLSHKNARTAYKKGRKSPRSGHKKARHA